MMPEEPVKPRARRPRSSMPVVPQQPGWRGRLGAAAIYRLICAVDATLRYSMADPSNAMRSIASGPMIFGIWHNRLALSLCLNRRFFIPARPGRRLAAMVSASRDGGLLARILELFGVQPVRGSTSRRGHQALLEMVGWAEQGYDLAVTPDGPRGPRCVAQEGVVALAQVTGLSIVPVSYRLGWKWQAKSWDRFQIPIPFSSCHVCLGELISVPREASPAEREELRQLLETRLRELGAD